MKIQIVLLIICTSLVGCVSSNKSLDMQWESARIPTTIPNIEVESMSQYKLLDSAFNNNSKELLKQFFNNWRSSTIARQDSIKSNNLYRQVITKILISFYRPDTIGLADYKNMLYKMKVEKRFHGTDEDFVKKYNVYRFLGELKYYVAQNIAAYSIFPDSVFDSIKFESDADRRLYEIKNDSIVGIDYSNSPIYDRILLYDNDYYNLFNEYIQASNRDSIHNTNNEISKRKFSRIDYLQEYINLVPEHWGDGWHIETFPYSYRINLNESRNKALIEFRGSFNTGGSAKMILIEDNWSISTYKASTWIQ